MCVSPRLRELRGERRLLELAALSGIGAPVLSQLERGERLPRPADMAGLELAYGDPAGWYLVTLESTEEVPDGVR